MKLLSVAKKLIKEQLRHFWIFLLTITMAPFFVFVYYLINEVSKPHYHVLILNQDKGLDSLNQGQIFVKYAAAILKDASKIPLTIGTIQDKPTAVHNLKNRKADALIIFPESFSESVQTFQHSIKDSLATIEFLGDLSSVNYMISALWASELLSEYLSEITGIKTPVKIIETGLGESGNITDFDQWVPGLLILSIIMLMFTASIAIVAEIENKTILRLKLSKLTTFELLCGVSIVQILLGIISIILTLAVAVILGFHYSGSILTLLLIAVMTSMSIVAFSLILAAATKTVNEILIVGNFPMFLFMFFTGAAFPLQGKSLFTIAGYAITWQSFMSPTHAVSAAKKIAIFNLSVADILPELNSLILLTVIYFLIGLWAFQQRHMKIS